MAKVPWFRKAGDDLPPEIADMDTGDLVEAVNKSKLVDQLRTDLTAATGRLSEIDVLKNQIAALETRNQPAPPPRQDNTPTSFLEDEDKAFNERMAPFAITTLTNQAQTAKFVAHSTLGELDKKIWNKYIDEIEDVMKGVQLQYQALPQTWKNALDTVSGRHRNEIFKMQEDKTEFFSEPSSSGGQGGPGRGGEISDKLTDEEEKLAKRLGLTSEQYLKNKKEMVIRG